MDHERIPKQRLCPEGDRRSGEITRKRSLVPGHNIAGKGNIHLYEKMGYHRIDKVEHINNRMDIVFFEKD